MAFWWKASWRVLGLKKGGREHKGNGTPSTFGSRLSPTRRNQHPLAPRNNGLTEDTFEVEWSPCQQEGLWLFTIFIHLLVQQKKQSHCQSVLAPLSERHTEKREKWSAKLTLRARRFNPSARWWSANNCWNLERSWVESGSAFGNLGPSRTVKGASWIG